MDKKNTVIGVALLAAAFTVMYFAPKPPPPPPRPVATTNPSVSVAPGTTATGVSTTPSIAAPGTPSAAGAVIAQIPAEETITRLANDYIEVRFTNFGGAIRDVAMKKFAAVQGKPTAYVFNAQHADAMLAFVDLPGLGRETAFTLISQSVNEVVYRTTYNNLEVTRTYTLPPSDSKTTDPYRLRHETTFRNLGDKAAPLPQLAVAVGTAEPANIYDYGRYAATGYSNDGKPSFIMRATLDSSRGMLGLGLFAHEAKPPITTTGALKWVTVKNQFFAAILTPDEPATSLVTARLPLREPAPNEDANNIYGITGITTFALKPVEPQATAKLGMNLYVGPKEYKRLSNVDVFKADEEKVMDFGWFKFFAQLLNTLMTWMHGFVGNWGIAIVLTTLTLKIATLPLTLKASKSMKRMQKLAPEMKVIREKFKDNPQKQQVAMMELYKKHKVNPFGGCIPMLLPMPFFFGFYSLLQSTAELRFAPFLWAHDLSMPDTVGHILNFPINIFPLMLGVTMVVQMQLTPQANIDKAQATMMKFMPVIFLIFCYNFSCALALYSTINGLFTIGQQIIINRMKDDGDPATTPAVTTGKAMKNVTPKKK